MKKTIDEHASRFDEQAPDYDRERPEPYETCRSLVLAHARADLQPADVVLDLGTGTGAIALALAAGDESAPTPARVVGRDISEGMLAEARRKAAERGLDAVAFGPGRFREPGHEGPVDVVVSNFAMHHLDDAAKREAVAVLDDLDPRRVVLGDVMLFGAVEPDERTYDPTVDDPSSVGHLVEAFTDHGFAVTAVERVTDQVGVVVAERPRALAAGGDAEAGSDGRGADGAVEREGGGP